MRAYVALTHLLIGYAEQLETLLDTYRALTDSLKAANK